VLYIGDPTLHSVFVGQGAGSLSSLGNENSFVGNLAGNSNTAGGGNSFFGYAAGSLNTAGGSNSFFGTQAGNSNTIGAYNSFFGVQSGYTNSIGQNNSFFGNAAGYSNTTGSSNVSVGANTGGSDSTNLGANVFVGVSAGSNNTTGGGNTMVGFTAGLSNTTGSNNVFYGYGAGGFNTTGSNNVYVAAPGVGAENNTIRIGQQGSGQNQQNATFIAGIYGNAPSGALPVVVSANGQLGTTTAGIGVTSFNGRTGAVVPANNDYGFSLLSGTLLSRQLAGNYQNPVTFTSSSNSFNGNFSGDGTGLIGVPVSAGSANYIQNGTSTQGPADFNISGAGSANSFNSAMNYQIGSNSVLSVGGAADHNLFLGKGAGVNNIALSGQGNVFSGYNAGFSNTSGQSNTYSGALAGLNSTGSFNTFIGEAAGFNNTGSGNTFLGIGAGEGNPSGSDNIYIGNDGAIESDTIRIGYRQVATNIAGIYNAFSSGGTAVYINSSGYLGTLTSSRRFKEQIRDMGDSSNALMKLRPVTFLYKPEYDKGPRTLQYGLIAEEVAAVYPDLVAYEPDGKPYTVKYQYLAPMLLNELQKQHAVVAAQQDIMQTQQRQIADMQQRLSRLEKLLLQQAQYAIDAKE
jgi:hypothetical protein